MGGGCRGLEWDGVEDWGGGLRGLGGGELWVGNNVMRFYTFLHTAAWRAHVSYLLLHIFYCHIRIAF